MNRKLTRRRFIAISAAAAGLNMPPFGDRAGAQQNFVTWRGTALGAVASMQIHHPDRAAAERIVARSIAEVRRLEALFSLYREDSALVLLNKRGALVAPAPELVELLSECRRYSEMTDGAFDATVQPLWVLYADHFSRNGADPAGPDAKAVARTTARIGYDDVLVSRDRIVLARPGAQVTLNGIAQGYITDRVVALLRAEGITQTLVDMGETRCLDASPQGRPWRVGIADPDRPEQIGETLSIVDRAVATSGGYGLRFDSEGRFNHLFDPKAGRSANLYRSVTVVTPSATAADALSTAFSNMTIGDIETAMKFAGGGEVHLTDADGAKRVVAV